MTNLVDVEKVTFAAAADMAEKLGLKKRQGLHELSYGKEVVIATAQGIKVGKVSSVIIEKKDVSMESYLLNGEDLYDEMYDISSDEWEKFETRNVRPDAEWSSKHPARIHSHLPGNVVVYSS